MISVFILLCQGQNLVECFVKVPPSRQRLAVAWNRISICCLLWTSTSHGRRPVSMLRSYVQGFNSSTTCCLLPMQHAWSFPRSRRKRPNEAFATKSSKSRKNFGHLDKCWIVAGFAHSTSTPVRRTKLCDGFWVECQLVNCFVFFFPVDVFRYSFILL